MFVFISYKTIKINNKLLLNSFSGVHSNFNSFIADEYKHGLIFTLLFGVFSILSDFSK